MKKVIRLEGLDCANCAAKLERMIAGLEGVKEASVSFMTQKITLNIAEENNETILEAVKTTIHKMDPNIIIK